MSLPGRYGPRLWDRRVLYSAVVTMNPPHETTVGTLLNAIRQTKTKKIPYWMNAVDPVVDCMYYVDCDEVYPDIFIGNGYTAKDKTFLKNIGITHVLNTAEGIRLSMVNTNESFYYDTPIKYLGLSLLDHPTTRISDHFYETSNFIDEAIKTSGKVYVHCFAGMSRSSTCVIAYLMLKKGMTAADAIRLIRQKREIHPNEGFLQQLADLDNYLRARGTGYSTPSLCL